MFGKLVSNLIFITIIVFFSSPVAAFEILKTGKPAFVIVVCNNCSEIERFAAEELSLNIGLISGIPPEIKESGYIEKSDMCIIYVGNGPWLENSPFSECRKTLESESPESFAIRTFESIKPAAMIVYGKTDRATLYGVYELLRKVGIRWYTPKVTRYPKQSNIGLKELNVIDGPCFGFRGVYLPDKQNDRKWETRLRLNAARGIPGGSESTVVFNEKRVFIEDLIPPVLYTEKQTVFPQIDNRRVPDQTGRCFTNPESAEIAAIEIEKIITANPGVNVISISGHGNYDKCQCPKCSSLRKSEKSGEATFLFFVNATVQKIKKHQKEVFFVVDIKRSVSNFPQSLRPAKGIYVRLSPDANDITIPVDESSEKTAKDFLRNLSGWKRITPNVLSENLLCHEAYPSLPIPIFNFISGNISMYHYEFVDGCFFTFPDVSGLYVFNGEMYEWLISELLWDRYSDRNALVREWLKGVYGNAWGPMLEYWKHIQANGKDSASHIYLNGAPENIFSDKWLLKADRILQRAYALSLTDSLSNSMVKKVRTGHLYARLLFLCGKKQLTPAEKERGRELLEKWHRDFAIGGYTMVTINQTGEDFYRKCKGVFGSK